MTARGRLTPAEQKDIIMKAGMCSECGEKDIRILEVHHIKPVSQGGGKDRDNLSVLCPSCHEKAQRELINPTAVTKMRNMPREENDRRKESTVSQSHISGPNVGIGAARDVHIHQSSSQRKKSPSVKADKGKKSSLIKCAFCGGNGKDPNALLSIRVCPVCKGKGMVSP